MSGDDGHEKVDESNELSMFSSALTRKMESSESPSLPMLPDLDVNHDNEMKPMMLITTSQLPPIPALVDMSLLSYPKIVKEKRELWLSLDFKNSISRLIAHGLVRSCFISQYLCKLIDIFVIFTLYILVFFDIYFSPRVSHSTIHSISQCQYHNIAKRSETDVHTGHRVLLVRLYVMSESSTDDDVYTAPCEVSLVTHLMDMEL